MQFWFRITDTLLFTMAVNVTAKTRTVRVVQLHTRSVAYPVENYGVNMTVVDTKNTPSITPGLVSANQVLKQTKVLCGSSIHTYYQESDSNTNHVYG